MTSRYDAIVVLGSKPDSTTWEFPSHVYDSLDLAAQLLKEDVAPVIAVSGKIALMYELKGIKQPFREADKMADYLRTKHGLTDDQLLIENESKDTIANLYELKNKFFRPQNMTRLLFIVADYRLPRLYFLVHKILGDEYTCDLKGVPCPVSGIADGEAYGFMIQSHFLADMRPGDDHWLDGKFYDDPYYSVLHKQMVKDGR